MGIFTDNILMLHVFDLFAALGIADDFACIVNDVYTDILNAFDGLYGKTLSFQCFFNRVFLDFQTLVPPTINCSILRIAHITKNG